MELSPFSIFRNVSLFTPSRPKTYPDIKLLFTLLLLFLCITTVQAQRLQIDPEEIKEKASDKELYQNLFHRIQENDTTLTIQEYGILYYGLPLQPYYTGSLDSGASEVEKAIRDQEFGDAYEMGKKYLKENPLSISLLSHMVFLCRVLELPEEEKNTYLKHYVYLSQIILSSGDGKSKETAFHVIRVGDEYNLMRHILGITEIKGRKSQHEKIRHYDYFNVAPSIHYVYDEIYFDITPSFEHLQNLFGK